MLKDRGVYVIDFIGNGMSSRAVVRKGKLEYLVRTSAAGQIFTVIDEQRQPVPKATLWLAGTLYQPNDDGVIVTPFSNEPGSRPIILTLGNFSSLAHSISRPRTTPSPPASTPTGKSCSAAVKDAC